VLPQAQLAAIEQVLDTYRRQGLVFEELLTRQAGMQAFISLHVQVPGDWSVKQGHDWLERIEADIRAVVPGGNVTTHLEPI